MIYRLQQNIARFQENQGKFQSNFEQRTSTDVKWDDAKGSKSNMHVNTDRGFDVEKDLIP